MRLGNGEPRELEADLEDSSQAAEYAKGIRGEKMQPASGEEGTDVVVFSEAVYASAEEGKVVSVE